MKIHFKSSFPIIYMYSSIILTDIFALCVAFAVSVFLRAIFGDVTISLYLKLVPLILLVNAGYAIVGLYPPIGINPSDEIRRLSLVTSGILILMISITFFTRTGLQYSRIILFLSWFIALKGNEVFTALLNNPKAGFRPVAFLSDDSSLEESVDNGVILGSFSIAAELSRDHGISHAIMVFPLSSGEELSRLTDRFCASYKHLIIIPEILSETNLWITPKDVVGNLGLEIKQNLLYKIPQLLKRAFDLFLVIISLVITVPLIAVISLAIAIDSRGEVIYCQKRLGKNGKVIEMMKFRTMYPDAEERLAKILRTDESLREEWNIHQKLIHDARVTRVGAFLRRWSLDEIPQIINIFKGEMSIVGPRPMIVGQEEAYKRGLYLYKRVLPGLTGLWQVSGRSSTTFQNRARLDAYYVRNWSFWLDMFIILKTPLVILRGEGAS
jgi:Undecaprenyl-phosphate galactose phosphotransferase WbaP